MVRGVECRASILVEGGEIMVRTPEGAGSGVQGGRWLRMCFFAAIAGALATGCGAMSSALKVDGPGALLAIGPNAIGEQCRAVASPPDEDVPKGISEYKVFCGKWEEPSGRIFISAEDKDAAMQIAEGWWRNRLDRFVNCRAPSPTRILDGVDAVALDCALRVGGWPYHALAVSIAGRTYLVESIPAAYPATELAVGMLTGRGAPKAEGGAEKRVSEEIKRLEATLGGASYSAGDLASYRNLLRLAQYYNFQGNHAEAEDRYVKALQLQQKALPGAHGEQAFLDMHIALELSNQGRFEAADAMFQRADNLVAYSLEPTDEARLMGYRAIHLANRRRDEEALELARKATEMRRELAKQYGGDLAMGGGQSLEGVMPSAIEGGGPGARSLLSARGATAVGDAAQSLYLESAMLVELGRLDEAKKALEETLEILDREPRAPRRWAPQVWMMQARIAGERGDWARAEELLLSCIDAQRGLYVESRAEGLSRIALGRVYAAEGRTENAMEEFREGFDIVGQAGGAVGLDDAAPFFRIALAEAEKRPEEQSRILSEMFAVGQSLRGATVAQTMAMTMARLASGEHEVGSLIRELQDARYERDALRERLTLAQSDPHTLGTEEADLDDRWEAMKARIEDLERRVQAAAPHYNQLVDASVSIQDLLKSLRPDEAFLQVFVGSRQSFVFVAAAGNVSAYEIDLNLETARRMVNRLRRALDAGGRLPRFPVEDAYALYKLIFGPAEERLAGVRHIIAVPGGPLLSLPFGVLVTEPPRQASRTDYSNISWMARKYALTLAPSAQSFVNLRTTVRPSQSPLAFIGFGDFVPHGDAGVVMDALGMPRGCRAEADLIANLPALPNTAKELRQTAARLKAPDSALILGPAFCKPTLKKLKLSDYRILYFATHGLLPYKLECLPEPALVLSRSPEGGGGGKTDDGLLTSGEIVDLKLDADLVVLSACDTGGPGEETGGEALSGMARAFLYAGARSLLVSHWEIPDEPTVKLFVTCFDRLGSRDATLAEAMQSAQIALMEDPATSHPMAWGGFTIVGDGGQRLHVETKQ